MQSSFFTVVFTADPPQNFVVIQLYPALWQNKRMFARFVTSFDEFVCFVNRRSCTLALPVGATILQQKSRAIFAKISPHCLI